MINDTHTLEGDALARAAVFDDFDHVYSENGGHIIVVAISDGVRVCWQCGEPFDEHHRPERMVEKISISKKPASSPACETMSW